jgi:hypothetical protein
MKQLLWVGLVSLALSACAHNPVPKGYTGPLATIQDSCTVHSKSKADLFYVSKVNGKKIDNSLTTTRIANEGRGLWMKPVVIGRQVPASKAKFTIVGRTEYAAPILALTNTVYEVTGEIEFVPLADRTYIVKGQLGEDYSAVWIEDVQTEAVMCCKIEVKGSAKLGILEK